MNNTDMRLFYEGNSYDSYKFLGSFSEIQIVDSKECKGVRFTLWAPNAEEVQIIGSFNNWTGTLHNMDFIEDYGIWTLFVMEANLFDEYKYYIRSPKGRWLRKSDPYARFSDLRPSTNSIVYENEYTWNDSKWMSMRKNITKGQIPMNIYEIYCGSWQENANDDNQTTEFINFRKLAEILIPYLKQMNYNFIEIMPVTEHPLDASWGYQNTGYFSVTSRYGTPDDFKFFIDRMHQENIGVILDWVPSHFSKDSHGLGKFDGTHLYESADNLMNKNKLWGTYNFDFEKGPVQSFLLSSAFYFLKECHVDGLRVDAVSNMIYYNYADYGKKDIVNEYGGSEYIAGIDFIKKLNREIKKHIEGAIVIAEESGSWENATKPDYLGGLGFDYKWNMGWMNDSMRYMGTHPLYRSFCHNLIKNSLESYCCEKYILPLSHDESVHGKGSILDKMNQKNKFSSIRVLYGFMMSHPGKKLMFMGNEFAQEEEWSYNKPLSWNLLEETNHNGIFSYIRDLNGIYMSVKSLWELDEVPDGFSWIDGDNGKQSVISFLRKGKDTKDFLVIICNFSDVYYKEYKIGVPRFIDYEEIINSDSTEYGGLGNVNGVPVNPVYETWNGQPFHICINLPACTVIMLKPIFK